MQEAARDERTTGPNDLPRRPLDDDLEASTLEIALGFRAILILIVELFRRAR